MKLYSIALPCELAIASGERFRKTLSEVAAAYAELTSGSLDRLFGDQTLKLAEIAHDTPATRAWVHTIATLTAPGMRGQSVSGAFFVAHLEADRFEPTRLLELLCWEGIGAASSTTMSASFELPGAPPRVLAVGTEGALDIGERPATTGRWSLAAASAISLVGPHIAITSSNPASWRENVHVAGVGIDAFVPLHATSLMNRDFSEFPIIRSRTFADSWVPVVRRAAEAISEYRPAAAAVVKECVRCVVPLVGSPEAIGSASREEALGLVFLPGSDRSDQVAECLLHEAMHQYLFRIEECGALFTADTDGCEAYYSPWRTDPRPLRMMLHGAFVFAAVADLYLWDGAPQVLELSRQECHRRAYHRARQVRLALDTVCRHAGLTRFGQIVTEAIEDVLAVVSDAAQPAIADRAAVDAMLMEHGEQYAAYAR